MSMGSHLPGKVQAGRCRVRVGGGQDLVSIVGRRPQVQVLEDGGQLTFEAGFSGHATCPPVTGSGAVSGSAAADMRIAASA